MPNPLAGFPACGTNPLIDIGQRIRWHRDLMGMEQKVKADITTAATGAGGVGGAIVPNYRPALDDFSPPSARREFSITCHA